MPFDPSSLAWEKERAAECPARLPGQCALLNTEVGVPIAMLRAQCDACWKEGGPEGGTAYRTKIASDLIRTFTKDPARLSAQERESFSRTHSVELTVSAGKRDRWEKVRHSWSMAESFAKSVASRGILQTKRAPAATIERRHASCFGREGEPACPALARSKDGVHHFCNECGCGDTSIARLDGGKLEYPYLECPRQRPGFSNEAPLPVKEEVPVVEVPKEPVWATGVVFNADDGGIGDCVVHAWLVKDLVRKGYNPRFYTTRKSHRDTLTMLGCQVTDVPHTGMIPMGNNSAGFLLDRTLGIEAVRKAGGRLSFYSQALGLDSPSHERPDVDVGDEARREAARLRAELGDDNLVVFLPKSTVGCRDWPLNYFSDLAFGLARMGVPSVAVFPSLDDKARMENFFPKTIYGFSLPVVAELCRLASVTVGVDSGPTHLAATMGGPVIALMGPTRHVFEQYGAVEIAVSTEEVGCVGCFFHHERGFRAACDHQCEALVNVKPPVVLKELWKWLKPNDPGRSS